MPPSRPLAHCAIGTRPGALRPAGARVGGSSVGGGPGRGGGGAATATAYPQPPAASRPNGPLQRRWWSRD